MKPGRKISLIYSGITTGLVLMAGLVFFGISSRYTEHLYYRYLEEKARLVAMERFEKDEMDSVKYQNVVQRRQRTIPTTQELFVNTADRSEADSLLAEYLDGDQRQRLFAGDVINFKHDDQVGTALLYYDNEGTFAVIVLSRNPYGQQISKTIGGALLVLILLSSVLLFLISRLYAARMVNRIDQNYQTEKLFVSNASHEINNPLTSIQGECEVALLRERQPEEYRHSLVLIGREADRIATIMQQLLRFSHQPKENLGLTVIRMSEFLQQYADANTAIDITEDFTVGADEDQLRMAIGNIVSNAHKYGGGNPVIIRAGRREIEIIDHGIGIPAADLPYVFSPFHRASNTTDIRGSGIGLTLSKRLLEQMGASISVKTTSNDGTTFVIRFKKA